MFRVVRRAGKKPEGKQSILASYMLVIQDRITQNCNDSAILNSVKLLYVVNIQRVYASCIWKQDSDDCWNVCRPHATIMVTIFPEQKRDTFICKYRTKRNHVWPGQKKLQTLPASKSHSEPREYSTLLFIFPDLAHSKLLFMLSEDQHYYFLKANNDFFPLFTNHPWQDSD